MPIARLHPAALIIGALLVAPVSLAQADPLPAPVRVQNTAATAFLQLPADAQLYTGYSQIFGQVPTLGPAGTFDWFASRQRADDDPRAIGIASADPLAPTPIGITLDTTVPGTVQLRTGVAPTEAVDVDGRTWLIDAAITPRPARTVLRGIGDGPVRAITRRFPRSFTVTDVVPTDQGIRAVGRITVGKNKYGGKRLAVAVSRPGSTNPRVIGLGQYSRTLALPGGRIVLAGTQYGNRTPTSLTIVDAKGRGRQLPDRRRPAAPRYTAAAGLIPARAGFVLDEGSNLAGAADLDKSAVVLRRARDGKVLIRRALSSLDFPKVPTCSTPTSQYHAIKLVAGPDGLPVLVVGCGNRRSQAVQSYPGGPTYERTDTFDDQYVMLGLRSDLTVRWWRDAPEIGMTPTSRSSAPTSPSCPTFSTAPDGRLAVIGCTGQLDLVSVPGVGTPKPGKLASVKRSGKTGALVRITCGGDPGKVCSGTVTVTSAGRQVGSVKYALPARPGKARGTLGRFVPLSESGKGKLRATLTPLKAG